VPIWLWHGTDGDVFFSPQPLLPVYVNIHLNQFDIMSWLCRIMCVYWWPSPWQTRKKNTYLILAFKFSLFFKLFYYIIPSIVLSSWLSQNRKVLLCKKALGFVSHFVSAKGAMDMFCTTDNNRNGRIWSTGAAADDDNPNRIERERERVALYV
jgi:hypothetical protein